MKKDQYFRHDASALNNRKLMKLCREEGLRGYGAYWVLIESLRNQPELRDSLDLLNVLAYRLRTKSSYLRHIVEDFELFVIEHETFHSPGLCTRMKPFIERQQVAKKPKPQGQDSHKQLIISCDIGPNARIEEKRREEYSQGERESLFDNLVADLHQQPIWREEMAMKSGQSRLFVRHFDWLVKEFACFLRLRGEEETLININDAKRRFYYWMIASQGRECIEMLKNREQENAANSQGFETIVDGRRTYLGHLIPDEAPPRPNAYSVWDEETKQWQR